MGDHFSQLPQERALWALPLLQAAGGPIMNSGNQVITGPHFITTRPTLTTCRTCHRPQLAATVGGIDRHIDPAPLTAAGELAALLHGQATYNLAGPLADHLIRRTVHHIRGGQRTGLPVVADHTCTPPQAAHLDLAQLQVCAALTRRLAGHADPNRALPDRPPF